jgi:hypothetical protein
MTHLPTPHAAARIAAFLSEHLCWSAFWDKQHGVWRVAEDDPALTCTPKPGYHGGHRLHEDARASRHVVMRRLRPEDA